MEYLDGTNLEELIDRNGPLPVERALLIAAQIAARSRRRTRPTSSTATSSRPTSCSSTARRTDDFVKVLDFGISKDLDSATAIGGAALTRPDVAIGTPVYMSPEQAAGKPADALTDVYAVGGLLYEMLTGCPPCAGDGRDRRAAQEGARGPGADRQPAPGPARRGRAAGDARAVARRRATATRR